MELINSTVKQNRGGGFCFTALLSLIALLVLQVPPLSAEITVTGSIGIPAATTGTSVLVNGDVAYLPAFEGMYTIDITDPTHPDTIDYMDAVEPGWSDISTIDNWLYLT